MILLVVFFFFRFSHQWFLKVALPQDLFCYKRNITRVAVANPQHIDQLQDWMLAEIVISSTNCTNTARFQCQNTIGTFESLALSSSHEKHVFPLIIWLQHVCVYEDDPVPSCTCHTYDTCTMCRQRPLLRDINSYAQVWHFFGAPKQAGFTWGLF